eukprot:9157743-Alexandrium_andersonii.AAC.1
MRKAHLRAYVEEDVYVALPPEVSQAGMRAKLRRSLHGTRAAPARWGTLRTSTLESFGFARGKASACCFYSASLDVRCVVHGDDFAFAGHDDDLDVVEKLMTDKFLRK